MKFKIIEEKQNLLLKRKELLVSLDYEGGSTPSKEELQKLVADNTKANATNIEISKVLSEIGLTKGKVWVKIWEEKSGFDYTKKKKETPAPKPEPKPEVKEEAPKEEKPPEKPKEEPKKEEPKEEKKETKEEKKEEKTES